VVPVNSIDKGLIAAQLGAAYDRFGEAERSRHVEMLRAIERQDDVAVHAEPRGDGWNVTICVADGIGVLSTIAGLFTAYRCDIVNADVFTLSLPQAETAPVASRMRGRRRPRPFPASRPKRVALDVFQVRALDGADPAFWQRFSGDLARLVSLLARGYQDGARDQVIERVSEAVRGADVEGRQLFPVSVELDNDASPVHTLVTIRSVDTLGFLFAFTNALTMLNLNTERAEIRTLDGEVHDTFWLTDAAGRKLVAEKQLHELRVAAVLIKHFTFLLPRSPNPAQALSQFNALTHQMLSHPDWTGGLRDLESATVLKTLADLMGVSQFLWEDFLRMQHESLFPVLLDTPALSQRRSKRQLREACQQRLREERAERVQELNRFKDREMFRTDLRHITGRIGFREFSEELSDLAEVVVEEAVGLSYEALQQRYGDPVLSDGRPCPWCACALGKFGGRELGFGSDIELIFAYEGEGVTNGVAPIESSRYFGELVKTFLTTLTARREGIFEIDLRLRPYGNAGPLAASLDAFRLYYSEGGDARQFERLALVKLRPVAGDAGLGARVVAARDAFVYSGAPLDVENILHLRRRQAQELVPSGAVSAKHSPGGLVDVEYFVQACQIAVGHADASVRVTNTLDAIDRLAQGGHMRQELASELRETYEFLRRLIDALRVVRGHARDLTIPPEDSREFAYLSHRLQLESPAQLRDAIAARMESAKALWGRGFSAKK
jgi:glutamate-ammonia-ligase adenylyltransferase